MAEAVERYARGDRGAKETIVRNAKGYTQLLSQHIPKEDDILYPLANRVLEHEEQEELMEKFEKIEKERIGEGKHHEYIHMIEKLEEQLKI